MHKAAALEYIRVTSELEALLLESRLIKKFKPFYNLIAKDDKSPYYIHLTAEEYPRPVINHEPRRAVAGPFLNRHLPTRILSRFRQVTPFCQAPRPVRRPCLYAHLGLCHPCPGQITTPQDKHLYLTHILRLKHLLRGQFKSVKTALTSEMTAASRSQDFEKATAARDHLRALDLLLTTPISPDEFITNPNLSADLRQAAVASLGQLLKIPPPRRIEMYDNAHLRGTAAASAMTVALDGEVLPRLYRHFTIKSAQTDSDVAMMAEILTRRLKHSEWPSPDLIVLDGGRPQLSAVKALSHIPLISLAKRQETLIVPVGDTYEEIHVPTSHPGLQLLMRLRDEAHRFSHRLHHLHRHLVV